MEKRSQPGALNGPENFSQEPHHIHDKTIDTSPGTGSNNIHDSVPEDDVSIVTNIKELFEEQDEKENEEAESKIMLAPWHQPVVDIAGAYGDSNSL